MVSILFLKFLIYHYFSVLLIKTLSITNNAEKIATPMKQNNNPGAANGPRIKLPVIIINADNNTSLKTIIDIIHAV